MSRPNHRPLRYLVVVASLAVGACADSPSSPEEMEELPALTSALDGENAHNALGSDVQAWIRDLRRTVKPFKRFSAAAPGGYVAQLSDCVESPGGGMGYHYGNPALIDGQLDPLQPEILLYEPLRNGRVRLVGVEFIVPFPAWTDAEAPRVNGVPLHRNESLGLWVLHVWTQRYNPNGIFEDFNPRVSCRYAATGD